MTMFQLDELQHSDDRIGPWKLYIYEPNSQYHRGGVWFTKTPKYPDEGEITIQEAERRVIEAIANQREVRICDGGDMLVYHQKNGILHGETFWHDIKLAAGIPTGGE